LCHDRQTIREIHVKYWLVKSEPDAFSIDDLRSAPRRREHWDGVRNYQARNYMRDGMTVGDPVFFYHSSCDEPAIVGIAEVASRAYPDHTAFDPRSHYFDPRSDPDNPRWLMVDLRYRRKLKRPVTLAQMKSDRRFDGFELVRRGSRLSVMPVAEHHWRLVLELAGEAGAPVS
jgi:predicted RNA-binding protein with PUA-like domain